MRTDIPEQISAWAQEGVEKIDAAIAVYERELKRLNATRTALAMIAAQDGPALEKADGDVKDLIERLNFKDSE